MWQSLTSSFGVVGGGKSPIRVDLKEKRAEKFETVNKGNLLRPFSIKYGHISYPSPYNQLL